MLAESILSAPSGKGDHHANPRNSDVAVHRRRPGRLSRRSECRRVQCERAALANSATPFSIGRYHEEHLDLSEDEYYRELIGFDDKGAIRHMFQRHHRPLDPKTFLRVLTRKGEAMMDMIRRRKYAALPGVEEFVRGVWRNYPLAICSGA